MCTALPVLPRQPGTWKREQRATLTQSLGSLEGRLRYMRIKLTGDMIKQVILATASQEERTERQNQKKGKKEDSRIRWERISGNEPRKGTTLGKLSRQFRPETEEPQTQVRMGAEDKGKGRVPLRFRQKNGQQGHPLNRECRQGHCRG